MRRTGTLDRGDCHLLDAGGWAAACSHMGFFLRWAAERELVDPIHRTRRRQLEIAPGAYVVEQCGAELTPEDFVAGARRFVVDVYDRFVPFYSDLVVSEAGQAYVLEVHEVTRTEVEAFLDRALAAFRAVEAAPVGGAEHVSATPV